MSRHKPRKLVAFITLLGVLCWGHFAAAQTPEKPAPAKPAPKEAAKPPATPGAAGQSSEGVGGPTAPSGGPGAGGPSGSGPSKPPFSEVLKDARAIEGLIKLYRKDDRLLAEITGNLLDRDFIVLVAIAKGIGEGQLLGGMTLGMGDDWLWQFRKVEDKIQIVRRNTRFRATPGSPEERAVRLAYTDSILFSLPILTTGPGGGSIVELTPVFMSDLAQVGHALPGFMFARDRSSWAAVKGFRDNVELQVAATFASSGMARLDTVPDSRGLTINIHYSISLLPNTGYQPRAADDRVGFFLTATKDFSKKYDADRFVRYVTRWDLRKADPAADLSPPKRPIVFWLEKTIPFEFRKPMREGVLEWNKAFEKAGFANAIEVRQQPDDADWDPEDINYNTLRWITAGAGFAMGPSRVNPTTGEILDADIIFDSDFLNSWKSENELLGQKTQALAAQAAISDLARLRTLLDPHGAQSGGSADAHEAHGAACRLSSGLSAELALGSLYFQAAGASPAAKEEFNKLVMAAMKSLTIHEVGHTLGLRHNFKSSAYLSLDEINTPEKTRETGLTASVMDYTPVNYMPKGRKQGEFFSSTIGPYDYWAIEWGYKPVPGGTDGEGAELKKIAARSAEPALAYATDEDAQFNDPDPSVNRFDLGKDPVQYAKVRKELVDQILPTVVDRVTQPGDSYERTRRAFAVLLGTQGRAMDFVARMIGGVYQNRSHKGDPNAKPPFVVVEPAKQREALTYLLEQAFGEKSFDYPPALYNMLVDGHWSHWGQRSSGRADFPVHSMILMQQTRTLYHLLSSTTLTRIGDSELKIPADQDAFTVAELLSGLSGAIFRELDKPLAGEFTARKPAVGALRRPLQRAYLEQLGELAMGSTAAPEDAQTLAYAQLEQILAKLNAALAGKAKLDPYSYAHLKESATRTQKVLDARMQLRGP